MENKRIQELEEELSQLKLKYERLEHEQQKLDSMNYLFNKYTITSETDTRGYITYVSEPFIEISGFSREELIGRNHNIVRHEDMTKEAFAQMWQTIKAKRIWHGEVKNRKKNGDFYWVESIVFPILDHNHDIEGYKSIRIDITHKKCLKGILEDVMLYENDIPFNFGI